MNPAFGFQYFEGFLKIFNEQSRIIADIFEETFSAEHEQKEINLLPYIARCTLGAVFRKLLNIKISTIQMQLNI